MFSISVKEVLEAANGKLTHKGVNGTFNGVSTDTRSIHAGNLFIALKGENFDGHAFIGEARKRGAAGAIVSSKIKGSEFKNFAVIQVKDTLSAFGGIAHYYRMKFDIPFIGITGSTGKTTAKEMIYKVLGARFAVLKNEGTENNLIGVPRTLLNLDPQYNIAVLELGSNHFGEIKRLAKILKPTVGIITNIGPSHLEFLKSESGVFKEKAALLEALGRDGTAIINADDKLLSKIKKLKCNLVRFGIDKACDFRATKLIRENGGIRFTVNNRYDFKMKLLGIHNVYNALIAISAGFLRGVSFDNIYEAVLNFQPVKGRLCFKTIGGIGVIDDTYNSNPQSINAALKVLSDYKSGGRKILVCGDMLELGDKAAKFHADIGHAAGKNSLDYLVAVGDFAGAVKKAAVARGMAEKNVFICKDNVGVSRVLKEILKDGDILLLKGSRRMRINEVVDAIPSFISPKGDMVRV